MFLRGSFPRGNYVGDKSSEMHSGAVSWGILPGVYPWENFPGAIIQGAVIRGAIFFGDNCPGGNCPGCNYPVGNHPGDNCPRG